MPDILTGEFEQKFGIYDQGDKNMIAGDSSSEEQRRHRLCDSGKEGMAFSEDVLVQRSLD